MVDLRSEAPDDFEAVRSLHARAFAPSLAEADLVDALRAARAHVPELCLVATFGDELVGHVMFSRARLDSGAPVLALAPMAVGPEHQRRGIGAALVCEGLQRAAESDCALVVVLGHPEYYPRFGFEPASPLGVAAPFEAPTEAWLAYRLPAYRAQVRGTVVYPEAFSGLK